MNEPEGGGRTGAIHDAMINCGITPSVSAESNAAKG